jgi:hypothetical protein
MDILLMFLQAEDEEMWQSHLNENVAVKIFTGDTPFLRQVHILSLLILSHTHSLFKRCKLRRCLFFSLHCDLIPYCPGYVE